MALAEEHDQARNHSQNRSPEADGGEPKVSESRCTQMPDTSGNRHQMVVIR